MVERALEERRRDRVVAAQERAAGMRIAHRAIEVDDVHQGVRRGLDQGEPGALAGRREPVGVGRAVAPHLDTECRQRSGCEQLDLVVPGVGDHEDRVLAQDGEAQA